MNFRSKYGAAKKIIDGIKFDSKAEAKRFQELKLMKQQGLIRNLERQVKFLLVPSQRKEGGKAEYPVFYIADFVYIDTKTGKKVVEDVKGFKTPEYVIKRKLMLYQYGITIREVKA